ncbi:MAG TPA: VanZ family protein [Pyrinomonadaceae bacterium]|nr:VanZ family protein [Pyrinomonadaceae bacterium]
MTKTAQRVSRYLPLALWMVFISIASTSEFSGANTSRIIRPLVLWLFPGTSEATLQIVHFSVRKLAHFTEYAVMGFLAARAFSTSSSESLKRRWFLIGFGLIVIYALLDEYHQSFVPSRTASIYDSMIDSAGGLAALLIYARRRRQP